MSDILSDRIAKLDEQLCFSLYSASNRLTAIYRPILQSLGLTYPQFVVMMALWQEDKICITELASRANLSKATMTPLLKKLAEKSLVKLNRVFGNDRQKNVELTTKGKALSQKSNKVTFQAFCATGLTMTEAQTIMILGDKRRLSCNITK